MVDATLWFGLGAIGMAVGSLLLAAGDRVRPNRADRRYWLLVLVPLIATAAYATMALGLGGIALPNGGTIFVPRYLDWLLTTPLHVLYLGLLAGVGTAVVGRAMALQAATIVLGFVGGLLGGFAAAVLYLLGCLAFAAVVYLVFTDFVVTVRDQNDGTQAVFRKLRAFMIVLWLIYPAIWLLTPTTTGIMDVETTALVVSYLDLVAKVGFGLIALNGQLAAVETVTGTAAADA